jgi:hypothetical protein
VLEGVCRRVLKRRKIIRVTENFGGGGGDTFIAKVK